MYTVREILPELTNQIIFLLTSDELDQQEVRTSSHANHHTLTFSLQTAARTVTDLCRKSGEKMLSELIVILRTTSNSSDSRKREGVCLMLCELMWVAVTLRLLTLS